jgi:hypothetical protein
MKTSTSITNVFYFKHDISESQRPEVMQMRVDYKAKGYGFYNLIWEFLASRGGIAEYNPKLVAKAISEDPRSIAKFLDDCINKYGIFKSDGLNFWSDRIMEHDERVRNLSKIKSENAKKRANKNGSKTIAEKDKGLDDKKNRLSDCSTNAERESNDSIAVAEQTLSDSSPIYKDIYKDKANNSNSIIAYSSDRLTEQKTYGQHRNVTLSDAEYETLRIKFGEVELLALITRLSVYKFKNNKDYASDFATIKLWAQNDQRAKPDTSLMLKPNSEFIPKRAVSIWDEEEARA